MRGARSVGVRAVCLAAVLACGPESSRGGDWMVGTFSTFEVPWRGMTSSVMNYEIRADGTFVAQRSGKDGSDWDPVMFAWRRIGDEVIEVEYEAPDTRTYVFRIMPGDDCNQLRFQSDHANNPHIVDVLRRGEVCLRSLECPPGAVDCECESHYCDGEPPACED